jgi:hypothetical protein
MVKAVSTKVQDGAGNPYERGSDSLRCHSGCVRSRRASSARPSLFCTGCLTFAQALDRLSDCSYFVYT